MAKPINLRDIYKRAKVRVKSAERKDDPSLLAAAMAQKRAARKIVEEPSQTNVEAFRKLERAWAVLSGSRVRLADEFAAAIRGDHVNHALHNSYSTGSNPRQGTVYCLVAPNMRGCVKVGYASVTLEKRAQTYFRDHRVWPKFILKLKVKYPAKVEHRALKDLLKFRVPGPPPKGRHSNEWFKVLQREAIKIVTKASAGHEVRETRPTGSKSGTTGSGLARGARPRLLARKKPLKRDAAATS